MGFRFIKYLRFLVDCVSGIVFDGGEKCLTCDDINENDTGICDNCFKKIEFCNKGYTVEKNGYEFEYYSVAYYTRTVMKLILGLKYKSDFISGDAMALLMNNTIKKFNLNFNSLCFVPSSKASIKARGYNQSEYLARAIGKIMKCETLDVLKKAKETKDQIGLTSDLRWSNLEDCFMVCHSKKISGKVVLLVDDVITTGATAFYCAKELKKNGAKNVIILTVAKSTI